jgi:hypothetical protein
MHVHHVHHHKISTLLEHLKADEIALNADQAKRAGAGRVSADEARVAADRAAVAASSEDDVVDSVDLSA